MSTATAIASALTADQISDAIVTGNFSNDELNQFIRAINSAREMSRTIRNAKARATLRVGDRVKLSGLKSTNNGTIVTLLEINRTRGVAELPDSRGRMQKYNIPLGCMEKVS